MNDASAMSLTGMAPGKKKTRRGRRGRGPAGEPHVHLANAKKAHLAGDHAEAKRHAFSFIKALPMPEDEPEDETVESVPESPAKEMAEGAEPPKPTMSGSAKLAAMLAARKKKP